MLRRGRSFLIQPWESTQPRHSKAAALPQHSTASGTKNPSGLRKAHRGRRAVRSGDGWSGAPDEAPFDRVHVTVGVDDLSPHWFDQLTDGGVLVAPITLRPAVELSVAFERRDADLVSR